MVNASVCFYSQDKLMLGTCYWPYLILLYYIVYLAVI